MRWIKDGLCCVLCTGVIAAFRGSAALTTFGFRLIGTSAWDPSKTVDAWDRKVLGSKQQQHGGEY